MMSFKIPYYGLKRFYDQHRNEILNCIDEAFREGQFLDGKIIEQLEQELAKLSNRTYALAVSSCSDALYFSLLASGVSSGDEVLLPSMSFIATLNAVLKTGAVPVFIDVNPEDFSVSIDEIKLKTTHKTKAFVAVPLFGLSQDYSAIIEWCKQNAIVFIEDAAQAVGVNCNGTPSGSWGMVSCFSFDPSKIIHAFGTGGAILTNDESVFKRCKELRYHGKSADDFLLAGGNSRISTAQANLLLWQLKNLNQIVHKRKQIAKLYQQYLSNVMEIELPKIHDCLSPTYHKYVIQTNKRDELKKHLAEKGIQCMIHYPKLLFEYGLMQNYSYRAENIVNARFITKRILSLPLYPELTDEEVSYICESIKSFFV